MSTDPADPAGPPGPGGAAVGTSDRPVFVVGCPRSGTTLLQVMLHAHPRLAIPPETRFVVPAYRERASFGDLTVTDSRRALARWLTERREGRFRVLGLDADEVTARIVDGPPTVGSAVGAVLAAYADRFGAARWGDKRPGYWQDLDVLLRMFPDAQVVHVVRDGRACVASLKRMPWWRQGLDAAVATWLQALHWTARDTRHLGSGGVHEVRYERLVADPEAELRRLCGFLGEEFHPAMLETAEASRVAVPRHKTRRHHARLTGDVDTAAVESWRTGLEPEELGLVEAVAGRRLEASGYPRSHAGARPSAAALARFARTYAAREGALRKRRLLDAGERRRHRAPVAALLTEGQRARGGDAGAGDRG